VGIPPVIMRGINDIMEKRQAAAQAQQELAAQQQMAGMADAVGKAGPGIAALKESGVIDNLSEAVGG